MFKGAPTQQHIAQYVLFAFNPYHRLLCGSWFKGNIFNTHREQVFLSIIPMCQGPFPLPFSNMLHIPSVTVSQGQVTTAPAEG